MNTYKLFGILVVISMLAMTLAIPVSAAEPIEGTVGIIVRTMVNDPFQVIMAETAAKRAEELGLNPLIYAATGHGSVQEQQAIVEDLIQQKVVGILLAPLDTEALKMAMEEADAAGIPVVLFDSNPIEGAPFVTAIGTDNTAAASLAADYLIEKFGGKAKVAQIEGEPGAQNALFRVKGFQDRLKEEPGMEMVASQTGNWTTAGAMQAMENIIQAHPDLDAVFSSSDTMAVGVVEALSVAGKLGEITLVTFDGMPEGLNLIKQGVNDGDVAQFPTKMGQMGIDVLAQLISGEKTAEDFPKYIDSGAELITAETADAFLLDTFGIGEAPAIVLDPNWTPAEPIEGTVGIIVRTMVNDPFQVIMAETAAKRAEELGLNPLIYAATGHGSVQEQQAIVEDLIQQKVVGILLAPLDTEALKMAMEEADAAGIPVVLFDSNPIEGAPFVTAIGTDNTAAASLAADYLIEKFGGKAKVAQIEGEPGAQNALFRVKGFQDRLKEEPGMEMVASQTGNWTTAGAMQAMENIIQAHPDLDAVFSSSDTMAVGVVEALSVAGKLGEITLVTFDGMPEGLNLIKQGVNDGDVAQFPTKMGQMGIDVLAQLISGEKTAEDFPKYIDSGAELITAETADAFLLDTFGMESSQ